MSQMEEQIATKEMIERIIKIRDSHYKKVDLKRLPMKPIFGFDSTRTIIYTTQIFERFS